MSETTLWNKGLSADVGAEGSIGESSYDTRDRKRWKMC